MKKIIILICFVLFVSTVWADYYDGTQGLTGAALEVALHNIIDDHTAYDYDALRDYILPNTDEDPNNTNNVILIYTGISKPKSDFGGAVDEWNREHIWAKSHGEFGNTIPCGTDAHHIRPSNVYINTMRGNKDFDNGGSPVYTYNGSTLGGYRTDDTFEPLDNVKGDVARMIFYMAVRYEGDNGEPDLQVVDDIPSSPSGEPYHAKLATLLQWHQNDPVDTWEESRNDKIYNLWQHNRNPFIDHPEFAEKIWSDSTITISDIQYTTEPGPDGTYPSPFVDITVSVNGLVSAINYSGTNFFITNPEGGAWNGIYAYEPDVSPTLGDEINITGTVSEYYGFTELTNISYETISYANPVPEPVMVNTGDLQESNTAEKYESVLIKLQDVEVTQAPDDHGQWYVDDGSGECQIDDEIYSYTPTIGEELDFIIGVVDYSYDEYAVNPRNADDLGTNAINPEYNASKITLRNFPNPVENSTKIFFKSPEPQTNKHIKIYDMTGRLVKKLAVDKDGEQYYTVWNCIDEEGERVKNGLYFYQINISGKEYTNKLLILN